MQNLHGRILLAGLLVLMMCGMAGAQNLTVSVDPAPDPSGYFIVGDTVRISGVNLESDTTYITLENHNDGPGAQGQHFQAIVNTDHTWSYSFGNSLKYGAYTVSVSPMFVDQRNFDTASTGFTIAASLPKTPTPTPTPEPTPDYSAKIEQLEKKVAAQETAIATLQKTPEPTTMIAEVTVPTPEPTATVNYEATIAAMQTQMEEQQKQIEEQGSWLDAILRFLGLK